MLRRLVSSSTLWAPALVLLLGACQHEPGVSPQPPQIVTLRGAASVWDKTIGGDGDEHLSTLVAAPDGGYLLIGRSSSTVSGDKSQDGRNGWVVKLGSTGTKQWDKAFAGYLQAGITTPDGGYLLGGTSDPGVGGRDFYVVKISADGTKQWNKTFGGSDNDDLSTLIATADGGFLLGGSSKSNRSGDKSQDGRGDPDFWIIKIDANGSQQWDKTYGSSGYDALASIIATPDGGFLLGGTSFSNASAEKSQDRQGEYDYWVVKVSADGTKQWDKTFGGSGFDTFSSMVATSDGGFLLAGSAESTLSGDKTQASQGNADYWVIKISADGTKQWDKAFGGNDDDLFPALVTTSDGGFLLAGYSRSTASGDKRQDSQGGFDYWTVKLSADGTKQWDQAFGGNDDDNGPTIAAIPGGSFLLGGTSFSNASGNKSENRKGGYDFWVLKIE